MTQAHERTATLSELVAEEIRALMARRQMSGRTLATRLNVSPSWVSYRLSGKQPIDLNDLAAIAAALEVGVQALLPRPEVMGAAINNPKVVSGQLSRLEAPAPKAQPIRSRQRPAGRTFREERRPRQVRTPGQTIPSRSAA